MTSVARAPGKLVLLGEYVVLEGAPALVAAMDRLAEARVTPAAHFSVDAPTLGVHAARFDLGPGASPGDPQVTWVDPMHASGKLDLLARLVEVTCSHVGAHGKTLPPCRISVHTDGFLLRQDGPKLGIGSSAAMSVALLGALLTHAGVSVPEDEPTRQQLFALAWEAHHRGQGGVGSGIDVAASLWGGVLRYQKPETPTTAPRVSRQRPWPELGVLPVWTGQSASTAPLVRDILAFKASDPTHYWQAMEKLAIYANAGTEFWALGNVDAFVSAVDAYYEALLFLGQHSHVPIVTSTHRAIRTLVCAAGAVYKPSGAGGGDLGVAFGPPAVLRKVASRLQQRGHLCVPMAIEARGLHWPPAEES